MSKETDDSFIVVEEVMDCRSPISREFRLTNTLTDLKITIAKTSAITSCQQSGHEIIVAGSNSNHKHDTWAYGDRATLPLSGQTWNSHVRGPELVLSTPNSSNTLVYQLTSNELTTIVKLRSTQFQNSVYYYNLKSAKDKSPIDGHTLCIYSSDDSNFHVQETKSQCDCFKDSNVLPKSYMGPIPHVIVCGNETVEQETIICDAIFALSSPDSSHLAKSYITAQLQFDTRCLEVSLRPSTNTTLRTDLNESINPSTSIGSNNQSERLQVNSANSLKLRVRITSFGVCIMPVLMNNYTCSYRYYWSN